MVDKLLYLFVENAQVIEFVASSEMQRGKMMAVNIGCE
jgi:hypothetical protein